METDTAVVFLWQQTVFVVPAEKLITKVRSRTEARGLLSQLSSYMMPVSNSAERDGETDFLLGQHGLIFNYS